MSTIFVFLTFFSVSLISCNANNEDLLLIHPEKSFYDEIPSKQVFKLSENEGNSFMIFLNHWFEILSQKMEPEDLRTYLRILAKCLNNVECRLARKLGKVVRKLSHFSATKIKEKLSEYENALNTDLPHRLEFFAQMDNVFMDTKDDVFIEYLEKLNDFCYDDLSKKKLTKITKDFIEGEIVGKINNLNKTDRIKLSDILELAIEEYLYKRGDLEFFKGQSSSDDSI